MTVIQINPGVCENTTRIQVEKKESKLIVNFETKCLLVKKISKDFKELDVQKIRKSLHLNENLPSYRKDLLILFEIRKRLFDHTSEDLHITCPIPCATIKAIEVELSLAKKKDIMMTFIE